MRRSQSKRVSFHQEVTVKEFIKRTNNNSLESFDSPDLYRAPINQLAAAEEEGGDMSMDITTCTPPTAVDPRGELTMMIETDMEGVGSASKEMTRYNCGVDEGEEVDENTIDNMIRNTASWSFDNLQGIVKGGLQQPQSRGGGGLNTSGILKRSSRAGHNTSDLMNTSGGGMNTSGGGMNMNGNTSLNDSAIRRSSRLLNKSSVDSPQLRTPVVTLVKARSSRGSARSASKRTSATKSKPVLVESKAPTVLGFSSLPDASVMAEFSDIDLLENMTECEPTTELSGVSLAASHRDVTSSSMTSSSYPTPSPKKKEEETERERKLARLAELTRRNTEQKERNEAKYEEILHKLKTSQHPFVRQVVDSAKSGCREFEVEMGGIET